MFGLQGSGPITDPVVIMSAARLPVTAPRNQQANQYNGSALLITWEPPLLTGEEGPILGYRLIYWRRNLECLGIESDIERFEQGQRRTLYGADLTSGFIIGLEQDIYYCVAVQVNYSSNNLVKPSQDVTSLNWMNCLGLQYSGRWTTVRICRTDDLQTLAPEFPHHGPTEQYTLPTDGASELDRRTNHPK